MICLSILTPLETLRYGFHKINKTPRGQRGATENQVWEFSHPKFMRGRMDLLEDIKRKAMDSEMLRKEAGDMYGQISTLRMSQADIVQQLTTLQMCVNQLRADLLDSRRAQQDQEKLVKGLINNLAAQGMIGK